MSEETLNKKIYEIGYHVMPNLSEEELAKVVEGIKSNLAAEGAEIIADQYPSAMNLAYPITKEIENKNREFTSAYFGWIKFEMAASALETFKSNIDKNLNILRFLLIKTVRESTLATPKLAHKGMSRRPTPEAVTGAPIDEAAVDKKIDEMIEQDAVVTDLPEVK